jgi:hypothetical protein
MATEVWQLLEGDDDDGNDIYTSYKQEVKVGALESSKEITGIYMHGFLSPSTSLNVKFDIYDIEGNLVTNKISYTWTADGGSEMGLGYGDSPWGTSAWGGDSDLTGTIESFSGGSRRIRNFQRLILKLNEQSQVPHAITYLTMITREKRMIRRRNLTEV